MILLDTCAIIWDALEPTSLSTGAREAIRPGAYQFEHRRP
jgi:PIN domain nuclease of toxin-antitoxin system